MEIKHLRTDNDDLRQQMENMVQAITKYASTRANGEENGAEIGNTIQQIQQNIRVKSNSKTKNGYEAMKQEEKRKKISTSGKKSKVSKSKKKTKFIRIPNQHSPLSKDQMKLLHDPTSFERYVKELDVSEIKLLDSSGKNNEKSKKSKSISKAVVKSSRNKVSPFRTDGLFSTYGTTDGNLTGRDDRSDNVITRIKKKGPSYSQLQNKKKKKPKKSNKRKQTFYEKVLSKTIGQPLMQTHEDSRSSMEVHYFGDPMNRTQNISSISAHMSDSKTNTDVKNRNNEGSPKKLVNYQPGGINISLEGRPTTSYQQVNRYTNIDADYPEILEEKNYYKE